MSNNPGGGIKFWAVSILCHRGVGEDDYEMRHTARAIQSESAGEAESIGLEMAQKFWPDESWVYSVCVYPMTINFEVNTPHQDVKVIYKTVS